MQIGQILELVKEIGENYGAEIMLFGSRVAGTAHERSDIDLAISGTDRFDELKEEIENIPTLHSFDIVDLDTCRNELLKEEVHRYGQKII